MKSFIGKCYLRGKRNSALSSINSARHHIKTLKAVIHPAQGT